MTNYAKIKNFDVANTAGISVSVFFSGCDKQPKCKGCFNSDIWNYEVGEKFTDETIEDIINKLSNPHIKSLALLGGDPMADKNVEDVLKLVEKVKSEFPDKKIWLWTWRKYESLLILIRGIGTMGLDGKIHPFPDNVRNSILHYIDVLVDGEFIEEQRDLTLVHKGSKNQRIINVPESLKQRNVVLYED